ncbi:PBSX family phage terminase large subunit [Nitrosospira sp. Nsp13]|uniref:PBSX family phage terminase large subunit n=1 Tax=Nitrosospira sp. Nsp13 TaxID=1855332 RepID=UPI00087EF629|nr:PBSX family phage terminase large subunit [Nitrosospira sp. Nsp13]SCX82708.1 phage terminase large subunit [Nitrosospira sp. Nsp13]
MTAHKAEFPEKLRFLFEAARYKILYGGRGGAKSWSVARALLIQAAAAPLRILCAREFQNSIIESVHHLLQSQIVEIGLESFYEVQNNIILGRNGSEFLFAGLRNNITRIKSFEGIDRVWVEEAQAVSKPSWDTLVPTVRKQGSEIWVTYNPELETDETHQRFVINPPAGAVVVKINWNDNPWFPDTLLREKDDLKIRDPDAYLNVWEGHCRVTLDGAIYARELRLAQEEGRIRHVPYDAAKPVHTFFDLGWADNTSIWFAQTVGGELRLIDYYSNNQMPIQHYINVLQDRGYLYGMDWLPHDARAKTLATGRSVEEIMIAAGRKVRIVPNLSISDGINAARTIFNRCYFDEAKCAEGLQSLRHYRFDVDPATRQLSGRPLHDHHSHAADAFRYFAVSTEDDKPAGSVRGISMKGWRA